MFPFKAANNDVQFCKEFSQTFAAVAINKTLNKLDRIFYLILYFLRSLTVKAVFGMKDYI